MYQAVKMQMNKLAVFKVKLLVLNERTCCFITIKKYI